MEEVDEVGIIGEKLSPGKCKLAQRIYTAQAHRFFDNLVTFIASVSSLGLAFEVQAGHRVSPYGPNDFMRLDGLPNVGGCAFRIFAAPILSELLANRWPTRLVIDVIPASHPGSTHPVWLTGIQGVHGSMIANAFVQYFEASRSLVEGKYTENVQAWPGTWKFGRVIRNALAHKGVVDIRNVNASPVTWRTLTYGYAQNGRQLLYQDLTAVELILLMEELDALL